MNVPPAASSRTRYAASNPSSAAGGSSFLIVPRMAISGTRALPVRVAFRAIASAALTSKN